MRSRFLLATRPRPIATLRSEPSTFVLSMQAVLVLDHLAVCQDLRRVIPMPCPLPAIIRNTREGQKTLKVDVQLDTRRHEGSYVLGDPTLQERFHALRLVSHVQVVASYNVAPVAYALANTEVGRALALEGAFLDANDLFPLGWLSSVVATPDFTPLVYTTSSHTGSLCASVPLVDWNVERPSNQNLTCCKYEHITFLSPSGNDALLSSCL